ncbi:DUF421 domain-containing protein [Tundrisphaera lichenicola]|uniref:DUF421 domain-containing protein n=1 Tax=Tundrisphaera lichenicola TaxID=2029860 RepID=UPI003EBA1C63
MIFDNWTGLQRVVVVGPLAYFALVILLRISGNRTLSKMNAFDMIITVALGSTLATVLLTEQVALAEGILGFTILIGLQYAMTWLSTRSRLVSGLIKSEPKLLLHNGTMLTQAMRQERVIEPEIHQAVREAGLASIDQVQALVLETDGTFSVVKLSSDTESPSALQNVERWKSA